MNSVNSYIGSLVGRNVRAMLIDLRIHTIIFQMIDYNFPAASPVSVTFQGVSSFLIITDQSASEVPPQFSGSSELRSIIYDDKYIGNVYLHEYNHHRLEKTSSSINFALTIGELIMLIEANEVKLGDLSLQVGYPSE